MAPGSSCSAVTAWSVHGLRNGCPETCVNIYKGEESQQKMICL
jgi:hypothetical protein